ncbi:pantetheine-phosphate adenylyltransferase, partial [Rodentibacter pneumotropicus]|uniref:pantetheine-phosphate adenylyltransferase n=1 Tax=Rodentibacter pneumotropicus TaxID=758 RepID=UPI00109CF796
MTTVIYPGTFDPITNGHIDIIERSAVIFPKVFVAVAKNPRKKPLFFLGERGDPARQSIAHFADVEVFGFFDFLANVIKARNVAAIIRGVRTTTDFEYEL